MNFNATLFVEMANALAYIMITGFRRVDEHNEHKDSWLVPLMFVRHVPDYANVVTAWMLVVPRQQLADLKKHLDDKPTSSMVHLYVGKSTDKNRMEIFSNPPDSSLIAYQTNDGLDAPSHVAVRANELGKHPPEPPRATSRP